MERVDSEKSRIPDSKDADSPHESGEIRTDYRTGFKAIYALSRKDRPIDYFEKSDNITDSGPEKCPFEPEKDDLNKTFFSIGDPWRVRVIYNKYPLFDYRSAEKIERNDILVKESNYGFSFVIIDTPKHSKKFEDSSDEELRELAQAISETERRIYDESSVDFVYLNKNFGRKSSGTLAHSHWQTLGYKEIPAIAMNRLELANKFFEERNGCLMEYALGLETERVILNGDYAVAYAPFAQLFTGESVIMPKRHVSKLSDLDEKEWLEMLKECSAIVASNNRLFGAHAYNILGYSIRNEKNFHAYMEIIPRVSDIGPMQMAGYYGSSIMPEDYVKRITGLLR
ncbi:MAG: hypothetical protein M1465_02105 [Candidatus Marsarchaeota archaeon]|jgi:UDPglucose--hexose-1-phosphate uridylyltransferase|nr:hypothetical protein [Candidatus Marsarchaeota archaeon]